MSGPNSNPAVSANQGFRTPPAFLEALQRKFAVTIGFDLACSGPQDCVAPQGFDHPRVDALATAWPETGPTDCAYLNPPFARAAAFARVASECPQTRTLALLPASVGTSWFAEYVHGKALVCFLRPRLVFLQPDGTPMPAGINRDLMLCAYGWTPGFYTCEDWRTW